MSASQQGHGRFREIQYVNHFGIRDQFVIAEAETLLTTLALTEGTPDGNLDSQHLKDIHKHLLSDLYPWAGTFRDTDLVIGGNTRRSPSSPSLVDADVSRLLGQLGKEDFSSMTRLEFADTVADYYTKLYTISPFPDGNARTIRAFMDAVAGKHDMQIEWDKVPAQALNGAITSAVNGNQALLKTAMRHIVAPVDLFDLYSVDAARNKSATIIATAGLSNDLIPSSANLESFDDVSRLARYAKQMVTKSLEQFASGGGSFLRDWSKTSIQHTHAQVAGAESENKRVLKEMFRAMDGDISAIQRMRGPGG